MKFLSAKMSGILNRNPEFYVSAFLLLSLTVSACSLSYRENPGRVINGKSKTGRTLGGNQALRDTIVRFVRALVDGAPPSLAELTVKGRWDIGIDVWYQGEKRGTGLAHHQILCLALRNATVEAIGRSGLTKTELKGVRLEIRFPRRKYAIIEYNGTGLEANMDVIAVRRVDKDLLREKIMQAKEYLLRIIDPERHGAHKYYFAETDSFDHRIYTIYTSSLVLTLLKIQEIDADARMGQQIRRCADFILSMQRKEMPEDKDYGAFCYSYDLATKRADRLYVVGTTAKTIFTLLELYKLTAERRYIESAKLAAEWLLTMQQPDGTIRPSLRQDKGGKWHASTAFSFLYAGQVLSALSRMHLATGEQKYIRAAENIACDIEARLPANGGYAGDDYRRPNPISTSWALMSLLDFYKASGDIHFENVAFAYGRALVRHQIQDVADIGRYGQWQGASTSSGNGWLNEVMSELYFSCRPHGAKNCHTFRNASVKVTRWIIPYIYSDENMYRAKSPETARGGIFWSAKDRYVRTDSVCHAANAFVNILKQPGEQVLINIPEKPVADILGIR